MLPMNIFMPMPQEFLNAIQKDDRFLVCFPRSGSRWIRLLLIDTINQIRGDNSSEKLYSQGLQHELGDENAATYLEVNGVTIDGYNLNRELLGGGINTIKPIIKSHNLEQITFLPKHKIVYLFRKPANVIVSYFHDLLEKQTPVAQNLGKV